MTQDCRSTPSNSHSTETDIRPVVAKRSGPLAVWLGAGGVALGAVLLFNLLDGQRRARSAVPTAFAMTANVAPASQLPPIQVPVETPLPFPPTISPVENTVEITPIPPPPVPYQSPQPSPPTPVVSQDVLPEPSSPPQPRVTSAPSAAAALVIDATLAAHGTTLSTEGQQPGAASVETGAVQTSRLVRRASTVAQGTLIPAVLETALDSTRPGFARAIVSNDVRGFDGSRILIPRGSRLYGRYQADIAAGQKRAFVEWTRLVRPDGVSIAIASPAADAQGRAGVEGRVNSHFLQRFSSAVLQTTMYIGVAAISRSISGDASVIVALPRFSQGATPSVSSPGIQPTLRVDAGTRVTVFVAQDLEFPGGDAR